MKKCVTKYYVQMNNGNSLLVSVITFLLLHNTYSLKQNGVTVNLNALNMLLLIFVVAIRRNRLLAYPCSHLMIPYKTIERYPDVFMDA